MFHQIAHKVALVEWHHYAARPLDNQRSVRDWRFWKFKRIEIDLDARFPRRQMR